MRRSQPKDPPNEVAMRERTRLSEEGCKQVETKVENIEPFVVPFSKALGEIKREDLVGETVGAPASTASSK